METTNDFSLAIIEKGLNDVDWYVRAAAEKLNINK